MNLIERLYGARIVMADPQAELALIWYGGHGLHAYNKYGDEVYHWNTGDFALNDASEDDVRSSMLDRMGSGEYF